MTGKSKRERELDLLDDAIVEDILNASDEEILLEFGETVGDVQQNATQILALFEKSVLASNKSRLTAAKAGVAASRQSQPAVSKSGIVDIQAARARLREFASMKEMPSKVTLAARKESELSDADILSIILDLEELGVWSPGGSGSDDLE